MVSLALLATVFQAGKPLAPAERITQEFSKALDAKDEGWFERHIAKDFVYVGPDGDRESRDETLGHIRRWLHPIGYHVVPSIKLVSARKVKDRLVLLSDLTVSSQLFGFRRMPLTVTKAREESRWVLEGGDWSVERILVVKLGKTVDGQPVSD